MIEFTRNWLEVHGLGKDTSFLLAVSGGMDSMSLWWVFRKLGLQFTIAHCNFCLRGSESDEDESFVKGFAIEKELVEIKKFDTSKIAKEKGISIQMAARELRYDWFHDLKEKRNHDFIVTAHHLNDQVETFIIQLLRNTDPLSLKGMPEKSEYILRPFLTIPRNEIEEFVDRNQIEYRHDRSNDDEYYLRNKIRHTVMPALQKSRENALRVIGEFCKNAGKFSEEIENWFEFREMEMVSTNGDERKYSIEKLKRIQMPEVFISRLLQKFGFNRKLTESLIKMLDGQPGREVLSTSHRILIDREYLIVVPLQLTGPKGIKCTVDELARLGNHLVYSEVFENYSGFKPYADSGTAFFDFDKLENPVVFRKWNSGDWFIPLGMKGRKKLSDFFIDEKYTRIEKERQWIFTSAGEICWVVGKRMDDRFRITDKTKRILSLEIISQGNE